MNIRSCCFLVAGLAAMLLAGCGKDNIVDLQVNDSIDHVEYLDFDRTITVVYSPSADAVVSGSSDNFTVTVTGNHVTIANNGTEKVRYELSGSSSDGFFKLYSPVLQAVSLNSLSLTNPNGAAVNVQGSTATPSSGKRTYLVISGSNSLADGASYTSTPSNEDERGVIFSEGRLLVSGTGALTITASGKSAIASDAYLRLLDNPAITINASSGHGLRSTKHVRISGGNHTISVTGDTKKGISSKGFVTIDGGTTTITVSGNAAYDSEDADYSGSAGVKAASTFSMKAGTLSIANSGQGGKGISGDSDGYFSGGTLSVATTGSAYTQGSVSAKAIKFDGNIYFSGCNVSARCYSHEAIESKGSISISDGIVYAYSSADDAINSASDFTIEGGLVCGHSSANDGLDANGNFYIKGGIVYSIGTRSPEVAVDANTEGGYKLYLSGGTVVAIGGLENNASLTQSCYSASSWTQSSWYGLTVGSTTYAFKTPASGGTPLVVSGASKPTLLSGVSITDGTAYFDDTFRYNCTLSGGSAVTLSDYTGSNGGGPGGGGNPGGGNPGGPHK